MRKTDGEYLIGLDRAVAPGRCFKIPAHFLIELDHSLLPSTNSRLILSAGTSIFRSPPVTLESTSTPFLLKA
ncbi:MAG TPA: hypothetical protein VLR90_22800 [Blastocatellia bacterium]|nr:hypothetical protein [Blastocatellia bacterium]